MTVRMEKALGLLILCLQLDWVNSKQEVEQSPLALSVQEGDSLVLGCNYTDSAIYFLQWYRQDPGKGLTSLLLIQSNQKEQTNGRLKALLDKSSRHSALNIAASQPGDSATYICALDTGAMTGKLTFGKGTQVTIISVIHQPDPSVYKLRGPKSSNTSVCLLTDFASQDNVTQEMKHMVFRSGSTALDVKAMDSKSNGALAWSNSINFQCNSTFETYAFYPSSEYSCDAKLVEKSFETDMNLNFQNLSVIALRILLLKVAGFNLLMTLRLWSS